MMGFDVIPENTFQEEDILKIYYCSMPTSLQISLDTSLIIITSFIKIQLHWPMLHAHSSCCGCMNTHAPMSMNTINQLSRSIWTGVAQEKRYDGWLED